jgi:hypothetical protein
VAIWVIPELQVQLAQQAQLVLRATLALVVQTEIPELQVQLALQALLVLKEILVIVVKMDLLAQQALRVVQEQLVILVQLVIQALPVQQDTVQPAQPAQQE